MREQTHTKLVSLRMTPALYKRIKKLADKEGRSVSQQIRYLIQQVMP